MHYIQDWWSKRMSLTHSEIALDYNYNIAQCKGIEDILGLWIPDPRFFVVELGLRIPDSLNCIPDSKAQDSRFSRIPDSTSETFPDSGIQIPSYGENQNRKRFACP